MAVQDINDLQPDDVFKRWTAHIERIKGEITYLFTTRYRFREIEQMFRANEELQKVGSDTYEWLRRLWGNDAVMAVRREMDTNERSICLYQLLLEMEARPQVLTRRRYLGKHVETSAPLHHMLNRSFDEFGITHNFQDPLDDHVSPNTIGNDRAQLEQSTALVRRYATSQVSHRYPESIKITFKDVNDAIDSLEPMLQRYYVILTGAWLDKAEATIQYNWMAAFNIAWKPQRPYRDAIDERPSITALKDHLNNWQTNKK